MNTCPKRWCWRKALSEFRGLTDRERAGFLLLLEWFENWRLRYELPAGREAAARFWKEEVRREDRPRERWQLEQWGHAMQWSRKGLRPTRSQIEVGSVPKISRDDSNVLCVCHPV